MNQRFLLRRHNFQKMCTHTPAQVVYPGMWLFKELNMHMCLRTCSGAVQLLLPLTLSGKINKL